MMQGEVRSSPLEEKAEYTALVRAGDIIASQSRW